MTEPDHLYIDRAGQIRLSDQLRKIPALVNDMLVTETRQARITQRGWKPIRRAKKQGSSLPYHLGAVESLSELTQVVHSYKVLTCMHEGAFAPRAPLSVEALWLDQHISTLATIEQAERAPDDIAFHVKQCTAVIDLPPDDVVIDEHRMREANRQVVTIAQVEILARKLGDLGKGLDRGRVNRLVSRRLLTACGTDGTTNFFYLGEVLDAHFRAPRRGVC